MTAVFVVCHHHWKEAAFLVFTFLMTFLPRIMECQTGIDYPRELEILILFFILVSLYLGEMRNYYNRFAWWDIVLHSLSGIIIGGTGFSVIFRLNKSRKFFLKLSPGFMCLFAFCFAVIGYFQMKHDIRMFDWLERKFFQLNPEFKK